MASFKSGNQRSFNSNNYVILFELACAGPLRIDFSDAGFDRKSMNDSAIFQTLAHCTVAAVADVPSDAKIAGSVPASIEPLARTQARGPADQQKREHSETKFSHYLFS